MVTIGQCTVWSTRELNSTKLFQSPWALLQSSDGFFGRWHIIMAITIYVQLHVGWRILRGKGLKEILNSTRSYEKNNLVEKTGAQAPPPDQTRDHDRRMRWGRT